MDYAEIGEEGLGKLRGLEFMEDLSIDSTNVGDQAIPILTAFRRLRRVNLYHTYVTGKGVAELRKRLPECQFVWDPESSLPNRRRT